MTAFGIVPARGGSKGIPRKNLVPLAGRPLLAYTVEAALAAQLDRVIVSTEDPEIAAVARGLGAEVPFVRPPELAQDGTPGLDPILHALDSLGAEDGDYAVCLQPTSPLRTTADIDAALAIAEARDADGVVSVTAADKHPYWTKIIDDDGVLRDLVSAAPVARRQDLPPAYTLNGAIFLACAGVLRARRTWYTDRTYAYVMPAERSLDIDTPLDLSVAACLLAKAPRATSEAEA